MSTAYANKTAAEQKENVMEQNFNLGIDKYNAAANERARTATEQNKAAYDMNRDKKLNALSENIATASKEMYGYDTLGNYIQQADGSYVDSKTGIKLSKDKYAQLKKKKNTNSNMFGGFLNRKKK